MTKTTRYKTFAELMQSVKEGAKFLRGELPPASEFALTRTDVKAIREKILAVNNSVTVKCMVGKVCPPLINNGGQKKLPPPNRKIYSKHFSGILYSRN